MKKIILILLTVLISCKKQENKTNQNDETQITSINSNDKLSFEFVEVKEIRTNFTENKKKYTNEYSVDNFNIKISDNLNTKENYNLKQVYLDGKLIFSTKSETWIFKPFYCKNNKTKLLFFEEGDESGTWGYNILLISENSIINIGLLEISSMNNKELPNYIKIQESIDKIEFKITDDKFYINENLNKRDETNIYIDKKTNKLNIKTMGNVTPFNKQMNIDFDEKVKLSLVNVVSGIKGYGYKFPDYSTYSNKIIETR